MMLLRRAERRRFAIAIRGFFEFNHVTATPDIIESAECGVARQGFIDDKQTPAVGLIGLVSVNRKGSVGILSDAYCSLI